MRSQDSLGEPASGVVGPPARLVLFVADIMPRRGPFQEPIYVERGAEQVLRHPFHHEQTHLRGFLLEADEKCLQILCDRYLNRPSGGRTSFRPLSSSVLLSFATIPRVQSTDPRDRDYGYASEIDVAFWFPIVREHDGAPHVSWFIPYIIVDNPYAAAIGRELYGFPKILGTFDMPADLEDPAPYTIDTMALPRYGSDTRAAPHRLLEVVRRRGSNGATRSGAGIRELGRLLPLVLGDGDASGLASLGTHGAALYDLLLRGEVPITFLRQLRDVEDPTRAAFQEIVEAPATVASLPRGGLIPGSYELRLPPLASHPIARDLGLRADGHPITASFWVTFDFVMGKGKRIWRAEPTTLGLAAPPARPKKKIAILGGGISALTTAWELTNRPGWEDELEVTVYQVGWRLGGKGASGRNADAADRIEEHGLHLWFGFYENAFRMIRDVYDELDRDPAAPLSTWQAAFRPHHLVVLKEHVDGVWKEWPIEFPPNDALPGEGGPSPRVSDWVRVLLGWVRTLTHRLVQTTAPAGAIETIQRIVDGASRAAALEETLPTAVLLEARQAMRRVLTTPAGRRDEVRRLSISLDLALTALQGILADRVVQRGFASIDDLDFVEWLRKHGAADETAESAPVRVLYDLTLAYRGGDTERPDLAAGTALQGLLRMLFTYKGAFMWKMAAGMGDAVFAPIHRVLARRGVSFRFFHRVEHLDLSSDQQSVEAIRIGRQATPKGEAYAPLVDVKGLDCWPSRPLYDQLVEGEELARRGVDLESSWSGWKNVEQITLRRGVDFDEVVLGIPIGALPSICDEIIRSRPEWQRMLERVETTATAAFQAWIRPSAAEMGWAPEDAPSDPTIVSAWAPPLSTWADMTHVAGRESWHLANRPGHIAYFCGPLDDSKAGREHDGDFPGEERARVKAIAREMLDRHATGLWPDAAAPGTSRFDDALLIDARPGARGSAFDAQYFRANVEPSDRYVLSVKGSTRHRLKTDQSGVTNLYLTGDWIDNGMNSGCIEASVIAGRQCARALCGSPEKIHGESVGAPQEPRARGDDRATAPTRARGRDLGPISWMKDFVMRRAL